MPPRAPFVERATSSSSSFSISIKTLFFLCVLSFVVVTRMTSPRPLVFFYVFFFYPFLLRPQNKTKKKRGGFLRNETPNTHLIKKREKREERGKSL